MGVFAPPGSVSSIIPASKPAIKVIISIANNLTPIGSVSRIPFIKTLWDATGVVSISLRSCDLCLLVTTAESRSGSNIIVFMTHRKIQIKNGKKF